MTEEELLAEKVAKRMEGLKQFTVYAKETTYYAKTIYAEDKDNARDIAEGTNDWGDPVDYGDFAVYEIEEEA